MTNNILIYNSSCLLCKNIAVIINRISGDKIGIHSVNYTKIQKLIKDYYGEFKHTFYLINNKVKTLAISVNGKPLFITEKTNNQNISGLNDVACEGCVDPFFGPWVDYECEAYVEFNWNQFAQCCGSCILVCITGDPFLCLICASAWCMFCYITSCIRFETICCQCPDYGVS